MDFFHAWNKQNYGRMGELTVCYDNRPINKRAGEIRQDTSRFKLVDAAIIKIEDQAAAVTNIDCTLTLKMDDKEKEAAFTFRLIYGDKNCDVLIRSHKDGTWKVMPAYQGWLFGLI